MSSRAWLNDKLAIVATADAALGNAEIGFSFAQACRLVFISLAGVTGTNVAKITINSGTVPSNPASATNYEFVAPDNQTTELCLRGERTIKDLSLIIAAGTVTTATLQVWGVPA